MTTKSKAVILLGVLAAFGLGYLAARPWHSPVNVVTGSKARQAAYVASEMREPFHF